MKVLGLVGPPGSGKSHRALLVAHDYSVDLIIDDGLLINGNNIVAGISSKRQATKVGAIKTAMFFEDQHAEEVRTKITELNPESILVLGTSEGMIQRIVDRLGLPEPDEIISIEEIASKEEIKKARKIRTEQGKHVVPAPTVEVKPRLSGLLIDPLPTIFGKKSTQKDYQFMVDQSVVQPTFNFYGKFFISTAAINQIITAAAKSVQSVEDVYHIRTRTVPEGIEISLQMTVVFGHKIPEVVEQTKRSIHSTLEHMTSLHVLVINIFVKKVSLESSGEE